MVVDLPAVRRSRILVVGSINMDLVVRCRRLPLPGETLTGNSLTEIPGGKGANQAVAAARLGADVSMIGRVGDDAFGDTLRLGLETNGVETSFIEQTQNCSSGIAVISVEDSGQNCITVIPGANGEFAAADLFKYHTAFSAADVLLIQLEVPTATVLAAIQMAKQHNMTIVLDPAPAIETLPDELFCVDVMCPNENEAGILTNMEVTTVADAQQAAGRLHELGARNVLVTLGANGVVVCDSVGAVQHVKGISIGAVDATAAGDAFAAAIGVRLAEGASILQCAKYACAAGALAASRFGAQPAMPTRMEVAALVLRQSEQVADL